MNVKRESPLEGVPDRYDGLAAILAAVILGWGFLYAIRPILGFITAVAVLSVYAVMRTADYAHAAMVVIAWLPVFVGLAGYGLPGVLTGGVLGALIYAIYTRTTN
ncbi:hypothetical protein C499_00405 [Halogeometricum borinquense DSM 11551]|uniref:Uncharacterized protein n=2 Tax=Halogeometricum borinquense TaxID=60847 RepID=E4NVU2_HALBP|nr:hypothetical protein [Halogeometricum borinquense]ADQ69162.1 hypothetical protein Hbor_38480 [Halogeometricum borinquense DSM 11551]ELY31711.1 hypothetical protein C499_00405 [Halogeometricum borinquense DSM 11551]RYJ07719.1 hypothetical protein ELS19_20005 [Halogeometricum borinquense]